MEIIPIVAILSSMGTAVLIVFFVTKARQRRVELHAEVQAKLIDRFGSAPELIDFLQSPAGKQFVTGMQSAPALLTRERILSAISRAIITTALGAAFLGLTFLYDDDFAIPAALLFCLGVGYLIAAVVSYKLSGTFFRATSGSENTL
jgi:hypothetical protein